MGREKALLPWPPHSVAPPTSVRDTFLCRQIDLLRRSAELVLVVLGANFEALAPVVYAAGAFALRNSQPERGQFSSLRLGVQEVLNRGRDTAIVSTVDRPPAALATVATLKDAFSTAPSGIWAVVPEFGGRHGHPMIAGRELIAAWLDAPPSATARDVEHALQPHIQYVGVEDPLVVADVNSPDEYDRLVLSFAAPTAPTGAAS
jgi:molybdenum cofactor cytidylyltransferase